MKELYDMNVNGIIDKPNIAKIYTSNILLPLIGGELISNKAYLNLGSGIFDYIKEKPAQPIDVQIALARMEAKSAKTEHERDYFLQCAEDLVQMKIKADQFGLELRLIDERKQSKPRKPFFAFSN